VNRHGHLEGLVGFESLPAVVQRLTGVDVSSQKRQKGVGSEAHDPTQSDIRKFFGGGVIDGNKAAAEEGRAQSNAMDETAIPNL
jgi:hypothetical protein